MHLSFSLVTSMSMATWFFYEWRSTHMHKCISKCLLICMRMFSLALLTDAHQSVLFSYMSYYMQPVQHFHVGFTLQMSINWAINISYEFTW